MITVIQRGLYRLIETHSQTKILLLDNDKKYAWVFAKGIGEILVATETAHAQDCVLSIGNYRLYDVKDEKAFSDQLHLELSIGLGEWQGYLLPTGFPTRKDSRKRIIPTRECITDATSKVNLPNAAYPVH